MTALAVAKELIEEVHSYNPLADTELLEKAFNFALEAHRHQVRKSGEGYISHPLEVAKICASLGLDTSTIAAALLHDVVEDTSIKLSQVKEEFGEEIASLVDGVTKIERIRWRSQTKQAENIRKVIVAMAEDVRVILIKLADRLHNMRTISHISPQKQRLKAEETLEVYAPLAHRLGIANIKTELEDLSFQVLNKEKYDQIARLVSQTQQARETYIEAVRKILEGELKKMGIEGEVRGRIKHFYSIYQKMQEKGKEFHQIYDLAALRVIVPTVRDCYAVLGVAHSLWKPIPGRFKDFIAMPKFNMYQSLHTSVIGPEGRPLEIQIRTDEMHRIAEYGIAAHWRYKEGVKEADQFEERLSWLRQLLEIGSDLKDPREFMRSLKLGLVPDEVYVFTPKGDVVALPQGATPIDFAYSIHTEVGHACVGAKVNNQIVTLDYELKLGDIVEILTSKSSHGPSRDWLQIAKTSRARSKIRQWFSREEKKDHIQEGKEALQKALRRHKLEREIPFDSPVFSKLAKEFNYKAVDDFMAGMGAGQVSPRQVATRLIQLLALSKEREEKFPLRPVRTKAPQDVGVKVKGVGDVLIRLAHCCNPVPGDKIVGFITRGRGVSIHRADCPNLRELHRFNERLIPVSWDEKKRGPFQIEIKVEALDRTKLLRDVSTVLSDAGVNILSANVSTTKDGLAILRFVFEIGNLSLLKAIFQNIKKVESVFNVERV
jgi:GTP pyrophosphokinase